eukprot:CAMPEP_0175603310 /NCGR_PEP_ID=MMETSP0096-20121207/59085_1 /TAXON_ID=311494 /ORGANISM="Alexandrium monilatum, Strain CCMP3105" /LENGTH=39 /DNA_ID= /DNA_START= /DNA_END= /DNA_ORIENTATION=
MGMPKAASGLSLDVFAVAFGSEKPLFSAHLRTARSLSSV